MRKEIEKHYREIRKEEVTGVDMQKVNQLVGLVTHHAGQVWQNHT